MPTPPSFALVAPFALVRSSCLMPSTFLLFNSPCPLSPLLVRALFCLGFLPWLGLAMLCVACVLGHAWLSRALLGFAVASLGFVLALPRPRAQKLGLTPDVLRGLSHKGASSRRKVGQQAVDELFDSAVQEVVDETNVPRSALGEPLLSGLVRQGNSFGAPTAGERKNELLQAVRCRSIKVIACCAPPPHQHRGEARR